MLRLAGPVVLAEVGWMSMGIVDTIMVGPLGPAAIGDWLVQEARAIGVEQMLADEAQRMLRLFLGEQA